MRRRRELPDTKIGPFPDNHRGDDSPAAHRATWGPNHDIPPLIAGEVVLIDIGNLNAVFSLRIPLIGYWIRGYRLVRWGAGQRVFPPQKVDTVKKIAVSDDGEASLIGPPNVYRSELTWFDSNRGAKAFEEAALRAVRPEVEKLRSEQQKPSAVVDYGDTADNVPF